MTEVFNWAVLSLRRHLSRLERFLVVTTGVVLLASSEETPGMLLTIPQCTRQIPQKKNYPAPNVNSTEVAKSWFMRTKLGAIIF